MTAAPIHSRASLAYRDAETHAPAQQIVLLHESAIRNLEEARSAIGAKRIEARFNRVTKAHAIVADHVVRHVRAIVDKRDAKQDVTDRNAR